MVDEGACEEDDEVVAVGGWSRRSEV